MPHWGTWGNGVRYVDDILIGFPFPFLFKNTRKEVATLFSKALRTIRKGILHEVKKKILHQNGTLFDETCITSFSSYQLPQETLMQKK